MTTNLTHAQIRAAADGIDAPERWRVVTSNDSQMIHDDRASADRCIANLREGYRRGEGPGAWEGARLPAAHAVSLYERIGGAWHLVEYVDFSVEPAVAVDPEVAS